MNFGGVGAGAEGAGAVGGGDSDAAMADFVGSEFARGVPEVKINAAGLSDVDSETVTFAREEDVRVFGAKGEGLGDFGDRNDFGRAVGEGSEHRSGGAENVENDAVRLGEVTGWEDSIFCWGEKNFE